MKNYKPFVLKKSTGNEVYEDECGRTITFEKWSELQDIRDVQDYENEVWIPSETKKARRQRSEFHRTEAGMVHEKCWLLWAVKAAPGEEPVCEVILGVRPDGFEEIELECPDCGHSETVQAGSRVFCEAREVRENSVVVEVDPLGPGATVQQILDGW